MLKRTLIFLTIGLAVMACTESDEYASAVIACQPGTALGVIENDLFTTRADPDNATHAAGYCVNTSELKEYCVTLQGATNTYACSKQASGMLFCGDKEVKALTDNENCGRCGNRCGENALCRNGICETNEKTSDCADFDSSRCNLNEMCRVQYRGTENAVARCAFTDEYCLSNYTNGRFDVDAWECVESENPPAKTCEEFDVTQCHTGEVCRVRNAGTENSLATCAYSDAYCQENYTNGYFDTNEWSCKQPKTCEDDHAPACTGNEICRVKTEGAKQVAVCAPSDDACASQKTNGYFNEESWACEEPPVAKSCEEENAPNCGTGKVCRVKDEGTEQAQAVCAPSDAYCAENYINGVFKAETWSCVADTDGDGKYDDEDECPYNQLLNKKISGKDEYSECFRVSSDGTFYVFHVKNLEELAHNSASTDENNPFVNIKQIIFENDINFGEMDNVNVTSNGCEVIDWDSSSLVISGRFSYETNANMGITLVDGKNHKITSTHPETGQRCSLPYALFNKITDCIVKDLVLDYDVIGSKAAGMLADFSSSDKYAGTSEIINIQYSGIIKNDSMNSESVGGLIGSASQTKFFDCIGDGVSVEAKYASNVGGLAGKAVTESLISDCSFKIDHILGCDYVGGVVGYGKGMMNPMLAENTSVIFDTIERSTQYKYSNTYIGGFAGAGNAIDGVVVVGNEIIGNESVVGGIIGGNNGYGIKNSAVSIEKLGGDYIVSGGVNMIALEQYSAFSGFFSNILVDIGVIEGNNANGFLYYMYDSNTATIEMITQHVREMYNSKSISGNLYGFSFYDFKYDSEGYGHSSTIEMGMISSAVDNFRDESSSEYTKISGFSGVKKTGETSYEMKVNNVVTMSNRPSPNSALFDSFLYMDEYNDIYYYLTSDDDLPFNSLTPDDKNYKLNDVNAVITKLNETLNSNYECSGCEWILKPFHNNTSNKDVNLPYLKQKGLEDKLAAQKSAHCEAFGEKSKFCP